MSDTELQTKVDDLDSQVETLKAEVAVLRRELRALGVNVPEMAPNPAKTPMSPEALRALKQELAARARAEKPVGKGKGSLSSPRIKQKLVRRVQAKRKTK